MKQLLTPGALLVCVTCLSLSALGQSPREDILSEIKAKRAELESLEKQFLAPSDEDLATHSEFLNQKNTGIIRLLPREILARGQYAEFEKKSTNVRVGNGSVRCHGIAP
ncbi:MAG TPA: hypothetical protein VIB00_13030 [Pyrinomonadaceae bacterium]